MTTEAPAILNPKWEKRIYGLMQHLLEQLELAAEMGGNVQVLMDVKVTNGNLVGEACFDLKHRFDVQNP